MNFSAWSIRNPVAPILAFVVLMLLGWNSFNTLPITRFPNIDLPLVAVTVTQTGAAPAEMESQITKQVEDAVASITGVDDIMSKVQDGTSTTSIIFKMEVEADKALQDVKDAVERVRGSLPGGIDAPIVQKIDIESQAIQTFAVSAPNMTIEELSWFVEDTVKRALQGRVGIGQITRYGGADREIRIELDPVRLDSWGVTAGQVNSQLRMTNINLGAGRSEIGSSEQAIRTLGNADTVERLGQTMIAVGNGRHVRLAELGEIKDTFEELRSFSRFNGEQVVTFGVFRAKGASEVTVAETVDTQLRELRAQYPDVTITLVDDTVFYTYGNYTSALHTLMEGALLAVLVVFAFLRNWRATLIAAVALPLSAVPTFWVMDLLGFSLNLVSFLAITLATGILVDDAIVEVENIARHMRMGKTPFRASIDAADEIGLAVIATCFTIVAVFVPVSFMPGIPGQYFRQFGMTVAIAVLFSLLVARLITPMMAAYLMRAKDAHGEDGHKDGPIIRGYLRFVTASTAGRFLWVPMRYFTLLAGIGVLAVSVFFMLKVPGEFMPPEDVSRISVSIELPPGATLDETDTTTQAMVAAIRDIEGIENIFVLGGSSPKGDVETRRASLTVLLHKLDHRLSYRLSVVGRQIPLIGALVPRVESTGRQVTQAEIESEIFSRLALIPDARAIKLNDRGERDISFSVLSQDGEALEEAVRWLEEAAAGEPLVANVASEGALPRPELQITPRVEQAARLGITTAQIAETLRVATIGDADAALAKISLDNRQIPVRVRLNDAARGDLARIGALRIQTATGATVPLAAVADITISQGPAMIERLNRERRATIGANLPLGVPLGTATAAFKAVVDSVELPAGVRVAESGDAEIQAEMNQSFVNAMGMGLLFVLIVLILLFKSVIQPFTIILSLPLAVGGVAAALILTNSALSMPVLIGMLMLMGIVTKNAILLIDFAIEMRNQGMDRYRAVVEAGHKRAQPIVMTSIAMSAGMLPSALGVGEGGAFRAPMATAVIGGIMMSTVLSLVVVPAFYLIMDDLSRLISRLLSGMIGPREADPDAPPAEELARRLAERDGQLARLSSRVEQLESHRAAPPRPATAAE